MVRVVLDFLCSSSSACWYPFLYNHIVSGQLGIPLETGLFDKGKKGFSVME